MRTKPQAMYSQNGMVVVFHHPVNRIAGQSVPAGKRGDTAVFHPAQPAFGRGPERTVPIELKTADTALAQSIGAAIRCADLTVLEIRHASMTKSKP